MMMRVIKDGEIVKVSTEHPPPVGAYVTITQGELTIEGRVEAVAYDIDANEVPAVVRVGLVLA